MEKFRFYGEYKEHTFKFSADIDDIKGIEEWFKILLAALIAIRKTETFK